jgi:hypothetical protein
VLKGNLERHGLRLGCRDCALGEVWPFPKSFLFPSRPRLVAVVHCFTIGRTGNSSGSSPATQAPLEPSSEVLGIAPKVGDYNGGYDGKRYEGKIARDGNPQVTGDQAESKRTSQRSG